MNLAEKIIVLLSGIPKSEAAAALQAFAEAGGEAARVVAAPVTDITALRETRRVMEDIAAGKWPGGSPRAAEQRSVLIGGADKRNGVALMRCFKSVQPPKADTAFALVTETGMKWTVNEYLDHICREHEYMKTADPAADPDMSEIKNAASR